MNKMAKKKSKKENISYRIKKQTFGMITIVVSLLVLAAVCFYSPGDSSYSLASDKLANLLGMPGASCADIVLTFLGLSLPVFLIVMMFWGYKMVRLQEIGSIWLKLAAWTVGVLSFAIFLDYIPFKPSFGGVFGELINTKLISFFYQVPYIRWIIAFVSFVIGFVCFNYAVSMPLRLWYNGVKRIILAVWRILKLFGKIIAAFFSLFSGKDEDREVTTVSKKKKAPKEKKEPKLKEDKKADQPSITITKSRKSTKGQNDGYMYPDTSLLSKPKNTTTVTLSQKELEKISEELENVLEEFGVNGKIVKIRPGPVVTLYELEPAPGTKTARVIGLADDIARSMSARSVRIAVVSGSNTIGIELPNTTREIVWLKDLLEGDGFRDTKNALNVVLGKDIGGENVYADLAKMPHVLVAGTTGSGKSVGMNSMILSLLYKMSPDECKLIMIDPKMLEFSVYNGIPHLLTPVITDPSKAVLGLKWAVKEMEDRYRAMAQLNVRNISGYNKRLEEIRDSGKPFIRTVQTGFNMETGAPVYEEQELNLTPLPYIVVVVDEMADLMLVAGKEVEAAIQRLAQMARAAGIHLILSTQRPSVDVITGVIKANFPTRISFQVTSKIDSRTILGEQGAEQLLGMGDMLYMPAGQRPIRVHGSFVKDAEVERIVEFLKTQKEPEYIEAVTEGELSTKDNGPLFDRTNMGAGGSDEDLYSQAVEIVRNDKKTSISYVQRRLRIGYNRAAVLIERMEEDGVLSAPDHSGKREIL